MSHSLIIMDYMTAYFCSISFEVCFTVNSAQAIRMIFRRLLSSKKKFRDVANTELMRGVYKRGFLLTFASFSLLHFLRVLKRTSSTEQFCREIAMTLTATSSTRDWYQEDALLNIINS